MHIVKQQNPGSAFMSFTGDPIDGDLFLVNGGESQEITLQVERGPSRYAYENLALIAYPERKMRTGRPIPGSRSSWAIPPSTPCTLMHPARTSPSSDQRTSGD